MARTILNIYDEIINEKENQTSLSGLLPTGETSTNLLNDLTSNSKVAVWRLWAYTVAVAVHIHETYWDLFLQRAKEILLNAPTGTPAWYQKMVYLWQFGDNMTWDGSKYAYDPIDKTKRIVSRCAIEERGDGVVVIKVAKGTSNLEKLTNDEIAALESYVHKIKFAGTRAAVFSLNPDQLNIQYDIYYDPIIPLPQVKSNVTGAIDIYLKNLPFNGKFSVTKFTDALQSAEGVKDPIYLQSSFIPDNGNATDFSVEFTPAAGWIELSDTIDTLFHWIPKVN